MTPDDWMGALAEHLDRTRLAPVLTMSSSSCSTSTGRSSTAATSWCTPCWRTTGTTAPTTSAASPDLESFLEAALLLPASVTADLGFPEWIGDGGEPVGALAG